MPQSTLSIPKAQAYGGVLLSRCGHILLREPSNHFDGYHWTFAKGKPDKNETPELTAMREVYEETGYISDILDVLPSIYKSSLSGTAMFIMTHLNQQHPYSWETQSTRWVDFNEAQQLISQSTNSAGRKRDLQILADIEHWFINNKTAALAAINNASLRAAQQDDWSIQDLPSKHTTVALDLIFDAQQCALMGLGFIPTRQEEKWFSYFADNILYQHRSWTGFCVDKVHFKPYKNGLIATHAEVNRDPEQYSCSDDQEDIRRITDMLSELASAAYMLSGLLHAKY